MGRNTTLESFLSDNKAEENELFPLRKGNIIRTLQPSDPSQVFFITFIHRIYDLVTDTIPIRFANIEKLI